MCVPIQTAAMLSAAPQALDECVHSVLELPHLKAALLHHTALGHLDLTGEAPRWKTPADTPE